MHTDYGSMLTQARDGFFLNLTSVMLKLCEPFLSLSDRPHKIMKVNSSYCAISSTLQDIEQPSARIHLVQDLEESKIAQRTEESKVFSHFVVGCAGNWFHHFMHPRRLGNDSNGLSKLMNLLKGMQDYESMLFFVKSRLIQLCRMYLSSDTEIWVFCLVCRLKKTGRC